MHNLSQKTVKSDISFSGIGLHTGNIVDLTIKHYLNGYMKSQIRIIPPEEWLVAVLLPVQRFKKKSAF